VGMITGSVGTPSKDAPDTPSTVPASGENTKV